MLDIAKSKQKYIGAVAPNSPFTVDDIAPMPRIEMIWLDELEVPPMQRDLVEGRLDSTIAKFDGRLEVNPSPSPNFFIKASFEMLFHT